MFLFHHMSPSNYLSVTSPSRRWMSSYWAVGHCPYYVASLGAKDDVYLTCCSLTRLFNRFRYHRCLGAEGAPSGPMSSHRAQSTMLMTGSPKTGATPTTGDDSTTVGDVKTFATSSHRTVLTKITDDVSNYLILGFSMPGLCTLHWLALDFEHVVHGTSNS